jgi:hypothetical protein
MSLIFSVWSFVILELGVVVSEKLGASFFRVGKCVTLKMEGADSF